MTKLLSEKKLRLFELLIIFLFISFYIWNVCANCWAYPLSGDPYDYLAPVFLKSHCGADPPLFLTIGPIIGIGMFALFIPNIYLVGSIYTLFVHCAILVIGALWLYNKKGFIASLAFCILFNSCGQFLLEGTYIRNTQTEALFLLLAFITFFGGDESETCRNIFSLFPESLKNRFPSLLESLKGKLSFLPTAFKNRIFLAGVLCSFAVFTKPTSGAACLLFFLYIIFDKGWKCGEALIKLILGGFIGILAVFLLFSLFVSVETLEYSILWFINPPVPARADVAGLWVQPITSTFPVITLGWVLALCFMPVTNVPVLAPRAYTDPLARKLLFLVWLYLFTIYLIWFVTGITAGCSHDLIAIYTFAAMGLSAMLGDIFNHPKAIRFKTLAASTVLQSIIGAVLLFIACFFIAKGFCIVNRFLSGITIYLITKDRLYFMSAFVLFPAIFLVLLATMNVRARLETTSRLKSISFETVSTSPVWPLLIGLISLILTFYSFNVAYGNISDYFPKMRSHLNPASIYLIPGVAILPALLILVQFLSSRIFIAIFLFCFAFIVPFEAGKGATNLFTSIKKQSDFIYDEFPYAIKQVPFSSFSVYVKKWIVKGDPAPILYALDVYRLAFDKKWPKAEPFTPQEINPQLLPDSKICITSEEKALPSICGRHILTDDPKAVRKYYPLARLIKMFERYGVTYYVIEVDELNPDGKMVDQIPTMTSNTTPYGIASASSELSSPPHYSSAWKAMDNQIGEKWLTDGTVTGWIAFEFTTPKIITRYSIAGSNSGGTDLNRCPKNWRFQGWNVSSWDTIHTVKDQTDWHPNEKRTFDSFSNTKAYHKYRIEITDNNGGAATQIAELSLEVTREENDLMWGN